MLEGNLCSPTFKCLPATSQELNSEGAQHLVPCQESYLLRLNFSSVDAKERHVHSTMHPAVLVDGLKAHFKEDRNEGGEGEFRKCIPRHICSSASILKI